MEGDEGATTCGERHGTMPVKARAQIVGGGTDAERGTGSPLAPPSGATSTCVSLANSRSTPPNLEAPPRPPPPPSRIASVDGFMTWSYADWRHAGRSPEREMATDESTCTARCRFARRVVHGGGNVLSAGRLSLVRWNVVLDSAVGTLCQDIARRCVFASGSDLPCTVGIVFRHRLWPMAASSTVSSTPVCHFLGLANNRIRAIASSVIRPMPELGRLLRDRRRSDRPSLSTLLTGGGSCTPNLEAVVAGRGHARCRPHWATVPSPPVTPLGPSGTILRVVAAERRRSRYVGMATLRRGDPTRSLRFARVVGKGEAATVRAVAAPP